MQKPKSAVSVFRAPFHDCDPFGHLNNAKYINHFIEARTAHLRDFYDFDVYGRSSQTARNWVVARTQIAYLAPVKVDQVMHIETRLLRYDARRLVPEGVMYNPLTGRVHAVVWFDLIYVELPSGRPARHEEEFLAFAKSIVDDEPGLERNSFEDRVSQLQRLSRKQARGVAGAA